MLYFGVEAADHWYIGALSLRFAYGSLTAYSEYSGAQAELVQVPVSCVGNVRGMCNGLSSRHGAIWVCLLIVFDLAIKKMH